MGKKLPSEVLSLVFAFSKEGHSIKSIKTKLSDLGFDIGTTTVHRILHLDGKRWAAKSTNENTPPITHPRRKRVPDVIRKVDKITQGPNPQTYTQLCKRFPMSRRSMHKIIHEDLNKTTHRKRKVHVLSESHKVNRKRTSRKLYENKLAGAKSEFVVTLDEALFYVQDANGERKICYSKDTEECNEFVLPKRERFGEKVMVVGGISGRGTLPLIKVPQNVKINAQYYVKHVLKPLLERHVPKLYKEDTSKVFVHHDAASSHTAAFTRDYAKDLEARLGIKIIRKEDIPVKSPDASPMDFYGFGYLKQQLFKRKCTSIRGIWKCLREEWANIPQETVTKVMDSWKRRLRAITRRDGEHVEQTKDIHKRRLKF